MGENNPYYVRIRLLFGHGLKWGSVIFNVEVHHSLFGLVAGSGLLTVNAVPVVVWMIFPYQGGSSLLCHGYFHDFFRS